MVLPSSGIKKCETSWLSFSLKSAMTFLSNLIYNHFQGNLSTAKVLTEYGAKLDVAADGFWGEWFERAFFDVRGFNPHATSNQTSQIASSYRRHENEKRRVYEQSQGNRTRCLYPFCFVMHLWNWTLSNN